MKILGLNAAFHDSAAALVCDGEIVAAAEEERFTRRKHGKRPVPFSAWELPEQAAAWVMDFAGLTAGDLDAVAYSYDPSLVVEGADFYPPSEDIRTDFIRRAPGFLDAVLPGLTRDKFHFVRHHRAHAASAGLLHPAGDCAVLAVDGRGEATSMLAGEYRSQKFSCLSEQRLPHSLGLLYEDLCVHLGFARSSDEYKVMALASYGKPRFADALRERVRYVGDGHFVTEPVGWTELAPPGAGEDSCTDDHADLAASVQCVVEEVLLALCDWLHETTGSKHLALAGGTALNCVANTRIADESPFESVWVQPAAGDSGTALGAALDVAAAHGETIDRDFRADLGRGFESEQIERELTVAGARFCRPPDIAASVAGILADGGVVGWFQGRSEFGPRALGHRSLLANPSDRRVVEKLNDIKGREQFRPVAPMVLADRAAEIFSRGPVPSPYMLFVHDVDPQWRLRIPGVVHVDGTARIQTVDDADHPLLTRVIKEFDRQTGLPVVVNTSLNTAGRPMVDTVRDALELIGSAPLDALAVGPFLVRS